MTPYVFTINSFDPWTVWLHRLDKHVLWCCLVQTRGNLPGPLSCLWMIKKLPSQAVVWLLCFLRVLVKNRSMGHYLYKRTFKIYVGQLCSSVILSAWLAVSWEKSIGLISYKYAQLCWAKANCFFVPYGDWGRTPDRVGILVVNWIIWLITSRLSCLLFQSIWTWNLVNIDNVVTLFCCYLILTGAPNHCPWYCFKCLQPLLLTNRRHLQMQAELQMLNQEPYISTFSV